MFGAETIAEIQSTLVISTSFISNNRLPRSENLVPVLTWKFDNRSKFSPFPLYFQYIFMFRSQLTYSFVKCGCSIYFFLNFAYLICRGMYISKYFKESFGLRDNESRLYAGNEDPKTAVCIDVLSYILYQPKESVNTIASRFLKYWYRKLLCKSNKIKDKVCLICNTCLFFTRQLLNYWYLIPNIPVPLESTVL